MPLTLAHPELFGVTETSATLFFGVLDASGPVDACVEVRIDGEDRAGWAFASETDTEVPYWRFMIRRAIPGRSNAE